MANPVVHFEIRSADPDASREFYAQVFDWKYSPGAVPGYTFVENDVEAAIPGAIGPTQGGPAIVTFFVAVDDVAATLATAESVWAARRSNLPRACRASLSVRSPTRSAR